MSSLKSRLNRGRAPELYFYRDKQGDEVDLLVRRGPRLVPVEIKSSMTYNAALAEGIGRFQRITGSSEPGFVIYAGDLTPSLPTAAFVNFRDTGRVVEPA